MHLRDLVAEVAKILEEIELAPRCVQLEFSRRPSCWLSRENPRTWPGCARWDVGISLDEFGSGVSSLEALKRHPVSRLKVDRSFLDRLEEVDDGETMLGPLVELARGLGCQVTVESVETRDQMQEAQRRGAAELQGYFVCRPVEPEILSDCCGPATSTSTTPSPASPAAITRAIEPNFGDALLNSGFIRIR